MAAKYIHKKTKRKSIYFASNMEFILDTHSHEYVYFLYESITRSR